MADVWDLASYVEAHPDNHEQRWRLAKKLYMTCDYRHALEHLQILKNEWRPKVNVIRYLAATHYRLGRYDEAVRELEYGMRRWPDEMALREQAARVLEVAERYESALEAWREILAISAEHPMAGRAIARLDSYLREQTPPEMPIGDSDSGIDISGVVCSVCGAQNSAGFSRCWQCHALLDERAVAANPIAQGPQPSKTRPAAPGSRVMVALAFLALAGISVSVFLTMNQLAALQEAVADAPILTVRAYLEREFALTRIVLGTAAALLWPVTIWLVIRIIESRDSDVGTPSVVIGLCAAAAAYLCTWLPGFWFAIAPAVGVALTLVLMALLVKLPAARWLAAWGLQAAIILIAILAGFIAMEGIGPVRDMAALASVANAAAADSPGPRRAPDLAVNVPVNIRFASTGSPWLDAQPHAAEFEFRSAASPEPLYVEFRLDGRVKKGRTLEPPRTAFTESNIMPDHVYSVLLLGSDNAAPVTFLVRSLLEPLFSP